MERKRTKRSVARIAGCTVVAAALALAACGGDDSSSSKDTSPTSATSDSTAAANLPTQGVTADSIKLGIAIIDYDAIKQFVDFTRGDQQKTAQIFVDYINNNGGVDGRKIVPVYKKYPPIPGQQPSPLSLCTAWTEDDHVFGVLGVFIDFSGDAQLCLTRDHHVVHIGHELEQPWIDESPGGLMITPDTTKETQATTLINLLKEQKKLKGKTVAILADQDGANRAKNTIEPALKKAGADTGSTAILSISGTDTTQAQSQMDSFIEKWNTENVDTVFMDGLNVSAKQFVQKLKQQMPDVTLITDASSTAEQAQDLVAAGTKPNPYEGMYGQIGATDSERWNHKNKLLQQCVDTYEKATGTTVPGPDEVKPGPDGKTEQLYIAVTDFCGELFMFRTIAEKAGKDLTIPNWQKAVDNYGKIQIVPTDIASLCTGKYAADDAARLVKFDSSIGNNGDWKPLTKIKDASGGKCADVGSSGT
jgi:ABC-type branched-subunit amino acid transport system substrate-binding protein